MTIKPATISQWMQDPASFSPEDRQIAAAIIKSYPYFIPIRYLEGAAYHKKQPFSPAMMNMMQLYRGNWLHFHEFMQAAAKGPAAEHDPQDQSSHFPPREWDTRILLEEEDMMQDSTVMHYEEDFDEAPEEDIFDHWEEDMDTALLATGEEDPAAETPEPEQETYGFNAVEEENILSGTPQPTEAAEETVPGPATPGEIEEEVYILSDDILENPDIIEETAEEEEEAAPENSAGEEKTAARPDLKSSTPEKPAAERREEMVTASIPLIQPIYTEDYFLHQGIHAPEPSAEKKKKQHEKSLMIVMSFSEWLMHFKTKEQREKEEEEDQKALKTMWQKEKLAAALEEENEEIPENVFEMAVNSITKEEDLVSESLAEILVKQEKYDKAIEMYRKLSLRNPQKNAYFARKIELIKEKLS